MNILTTPIVFGSDFIGGFVPTTPPTYWLIAVGIVAAVAAIVLAVLLLRKFGFSRAGIMKNLRSTAIGLVVVVALLGGGISLIVAGSPSGGPAASATSFAKWASARYRVTLDAASANALLAGKSASATIKGAGQDVHGTMHDGALYIVDANGAELQRAPKKASSGGGSS